MIDILGEKALGAERWVRLGRGSLPRRRGPACLLSKSATLIAALAAWHLSVHQAWAQPGDAHLPTVSIQVLRNAAEHGPSPGAFAVTRTEPFDQSLDVEYQISGTASNAVDYQRLSGRVTIPAGQASAQVAVVPFDRHSAGALETVVLTLVSRNRPFSIVLLPDTQCYTSASWGGLPEMFTAQTRWIADHKDSQNIAFVLHEGDVTEANIGLEWQRARASMSLLDGVVPYAIAVGNHDGLMGRTSQTFLFNQFFPAADFQVQPNFGGVFESNRMDNCYHLFSAGGIDWLLLVLEFGPRNEVLTWANEMVSTHPHRKVILLTHAHVYVDNTLHGSLPTHLWTPTSYGRENNGTDVWDKLIRLHPDIAFVFNGHVLFNGTGQLIGTNDYGKQVFQMLADYQTRPGGGGGLLRLVQFFPEQDSMSVKTYSPYLDSWLHDSEEEFTYTNLGVFGAANPGYLVDSSQGSASLVITNDDLSLNPPELVSGSYLGVPPVFTLTFNVRLDPASAQAVTNFLLSDGTPLVAADISPDGKSVILTAGSDLVEGSDYGLASKDVQSFAGIGLSNGALWSFTYHALIAKDDFSAGNLSAYSIVDEGAVEGPSAWLEARGRLLQSSNIYGPNGSALDHRQGTFAVWNAPGALNWTNYAVSVSFRNTDDDGLGLLFRYQNPSNYYKVELDAQRTFRTLFKVVGGVESTLASETNGYEPGQDYQLQVLVTNHVIRVRLNGTPLFGGPVLDSSLSAGTIALYSWGSQGVSFLNLTVTPSPPLQPPVVTINSPTPAAAFQQLSAIPISVTALGVEGSIVELEIMDGGKSLTSFSQPPYYFEWTNATPGAHRLIVSAVNSLELTATTEVSIDVQPAYPAAVWAQQPRTQAVPAGSGVLFSAQATSAAPLSYQWYFNDQPISGASHRLFFQNAVDKTNRGNYWVVASNPSFSSTSRVAILSLAKPTGIVASDLLGLHRLSIAGVDEEGVPVLSLEARSEGPFTIEASSFHLTNWLPLGNYTNTGSPFFLRDPAGPLHFDDPFMEETYPHARFYRTVTHP